MSSINRYRYSLKHYLPNMKQKDESLKILLHVFQQTFKTGGTRKTFSFRTNANTGVSWKRPTGTGGTIPNRGQVQTVQLPKTVQKPTVSFPQTVQQQPNQNTQQNVSSLFLNVACVCVYGINN